MNSLNRMSKKNYLGLVSTLLLLVSCAQILTTECPNCEDKLCNSNGECLRGCAPGFVDISCENRCPENCFNNVCHVDKTRGTYTCSRGCNDGFCGVHCRGRCKEGCSTCDQVSCSVCNVTRCREGTYGQSCSGICNPQFESCDIDTGACIKCKTGYYGDACDKECPPCLPRNEVHRRICQSGCEICSSEECPMNCASQSTGQKPLCSRSTGDCFSGCIPGFWGKRCSMDCNQNCVDKTCYKDTGQCEDEYTIDIKRHLAVIIIPAVVVFLTVAAILLLIKLRHRRTNARPTTPFEAERRNLLTTNIDHCAEALGKKTKEEMRWRTNEMVNVSAVSTVIERLERGENWITITGNPGDGKTTVGFLVLKVFQKKMKIYKIDSPEDYRIVSLTRAQKIILLDDIFGAFTSDSFAINRWIPVVRQILEDHEINRGRANEKVILTSRLNVVQDAQGYLERYGDKMLKETCVVDLTKIKKKEERMKILEYHLRKKSVFSDVTLEQMEMVVELDTPHGFPHCCKTFSELRAENKPIDMVEFFQYPLKFLNDTTKVLLKTHGCRSLFKEMIKSDGKFDVNTVGEDDKRDVLLSAADSLEGSYIWKDSHTVLQFTHDAIYKSVLRTVAKEDPLFVAKHASLKVILENVDITSSEDTASRFINMRPQPNVLKTLAQRIQSVFNDHDSFQCFRERLCHNAEFCTALIDHCQQIRKDKTTQYVNTKDRHGSTMLTTAAMLGNSIAVNVLVMKGADVNIADEHGRMPLHYLCGASLLADEGPSDAPSDALSGPVCRHVIDRECIDLVLDKGADVNKCDKDEETPLDILRRHHPEKRDVINKLETASRSKPAAN